MLTKNYLAIYAKSFNWAGFFLPKKTLKKCITFGWNSTGLGKKRGFEITRILIVCHGSMHNDTICTVEERI